MIVDNGRRPRMALHRVYVVCARLTQHALSPLSTILLPLTPVTSDDDHFSLAYPRPSTTPTTITPLNTLFLIGKSRDVFGGRGDRPTWRKKPEEKENRARLRHVQAEERCVCHSDAELVVDLIFVQSPLYVLQH